MSWLAAMIFTVVALAIVYWFDYRRGQDREKVLWDKLDSLMNDNKSLTDALLKHAGVPVLFRPIVRQPSDGYWDRKVG